MRTERAYPRIEGRPILLVHASERGRALAGRLAGKQPRFICTVAHTETAEIDGLSGAGATAELRRLTAAADTEALHHGHPLCMVGVPSNPNGAPGPVIITLAGLRLAGIGSTVVDAGLRVRPDAPTIVVADRWGESIVSGRAVPHAAALFERGLSLADELSRDADYVVLAESVPGGTTTALAVLCGLGIDAWGKVSSSMPDNAHPLKSRVVGEALLAAGLTGRPGERPAIDIAAAVGDPMQPFVAGLALGAHRRMPVLLAGGSQMAAVLALLVGVARDRGETLDLDQLGIATTSWVAHDPTADLAGLVAAIGDVPVFASDLDFSASRHVPLRRYEQFLVKEGVGAGAAAVIASLRVDADHDRLLRAIEAVYAEIYGVEDVERPDSTGTISC